MTALDDNAVIMITGATTGIGLAMATCFLQYKYRLVLTARGSSLPRFESLGIVANERIKIAPLDVTDPEQANEVIAMVERDWGGVDVLINNAAVAYRSVMEHLEDEDEEIQFHVNYLGPLHLIRQVLPSMRARRRGHIINLSSVGGMMAMPTMGGYSASKFALEGASEALWYELRPWNVHVTLVEPGFVKSESFNNAVYSKKSEWSLGCREDEYHEYYTNMYSFIKKMMFGSRATPEVIARKVLRCMRSKRPPLRLAVTVDAVIFDLLRRFLPKRLYHALLFRSLPKIKRWVD